MIAPLPAHPLLIDAEHLAGPTRHANELHWRLRLADGREVLLARLVDELAADLSIRRRYRRDVARVAALELPALAQVIAWGPQTCEQDEDEDEGGDTADASAPWRLRLDPSGEGMQDWLDAHAPAPPDLVASKLSALAEALVPLHARGLVVRDLSPRTLVETSAGELRLIDVGLARTDILSTRTAASLVLEGSPYTAPELLGRTAVDGRADLYALGVLAFVALTGELPFGDTHALLRPDHSAPAPSTIHAGIPTELDALIVALLEVDPGARPDTAQLVADVLRGEAELPSRSLARTRCQSCGAALPMAQRLCLSCGKLAVQFTHADTAREPGPLYELVLRKAKEDAVFIAALRELCGQLAEGEVPALNFVIGDPRMYSKSERERAVKLPLTLFNDLDLDTGLALQARFEGRGIKLELEKARARGAADDPGALSRRQKGGLAIGGTSAVGIGVGITLAAGLPILAGLGAVALLSTAVLSIAGFSMRKSNKKRLGRWGYAMLGLRSLPAALPASDPLVARLAGRLGPERDLAPDVHALVSRLALSVQRIVDHRAHNLGAAEEIALAVSALEPLVASIEARVSAIEALDQALAELDEGRLVRALAAAEARGEGAEAQARILEGLDHLRELEVERARALSGLTQACDLARRSVELGLRVHDEDAEHERRVAMALHALESSGQA